MIETLIDTNIAFHLRDGEPDISRRIAALERLPCLSIVSRIELENGVYRDPAMTPIIRNRLALMVDQMTTLPFDGAALFAYRAIFAARGYARSRMFDRMIAAHALSIDATLITINGSDFRDVPGLRLEIWPSPDGG